MKNEKLMRRTTILGQEFSLIVNYLVSALKGIINSSFNWRLL